MSITGKSVVKSHCLRFVDFISTTLGEEVEDSISAFEVDLEPKMTVTISSFAIMII